MTTISINIEGLEPLQRGLATAPKTVIREAGRAVEKSIYKIEELAKQEAPVNKSPMVTGGSLRQSITSHMTSSVGGVVVAGAKYAAAVHEGVGPKPGRFVPGLGSDGRGRRLVNPPRGIWPGIRANPYMRRGVERAAAFITKYFQLAVDNVAKAVANQ